MGHGTTAWTTASVAITFHYIMTLGIDTGFFVVEGGVRVLASSAISNAFVTCVHFSSKCIDEKTKCLGSE